MELGPAVKRGGSSGNKHHLSFSEIFIELVILAMARICGCRDSMSVPRTGGDE